MAKVSTYGTTLDVTAPATTRLLNLPLELQRMIYDRYYSPWTLRIIDNYWRISRFSYFSLDKYCTDPEYEPFLLEGLPSVSLSLTCKHIYRETQTSILKSYTGCLEIVAQSSHPRLPTLPLWISSLYKMTKHLILDERAFVDLFRQTDFPMLRELEISCFPIFCPDNPSGQFAPLDDAGFRLWAWKHWMELERRSGKKLLNVAYVTALDSHAEQWDSDEAVFCYLEPDVHSIQIVRERVNVVRGGIANIGDDDLVVCEDDERVCAWTCPDSQSNKSSADSSGNIDSPEAVSASI